jgi:serine/threonine-protein kinase
MPALIGRYEIVRLLGRGAMGRVLLALDPVLDRSVAVKLLRDDLVIPEELQNTLIDRMRQEARASARITHPNIVALFDMGEDPELGLYLVFEYAEGVTLKDRLLRGPLGATAAATLARELGDALSTAHTKGVLHRDIKPENVILTNTGSKIADFGIARVPNSTLTRNGGLLGTPAYSAPECIVHGTFSAASDQFSLAATLYEAISQRRAFPGEDAVSVASRITTDEAPPIARACGLSPHVDEVLDRALSKDPSRRYESAREFGRALAEALELLPRNTLPTLPDEQHRISWRAQQGESRSARDRIGGAALGALLGVAAMQITHNLREKNEPGPPPHAREPVVQTTKTAIGWLAPSPRVRRSPRAASSARPEKRPPPDAGVVQEKSGEPDAGTAPPETDLERPSQP